jgi:septum formation protein
LGLLRGAGVPTRVVVSSVDEAALTAAWDSTDAAGLVQALADAKAADVVRQLGTVSRPTIVIAADSLFRFDGELLGKPGTAENARQRLADLSGRVGHLLTGHCLVLLWPDGRRTDTHAVAATEVRFAEFDADELADYVATGEPLNVAGGFTLDGLAAPLIQAITGDPSNVIGLSLPLVRRLLADLGVYWPDLWRSACS